MPKIPRQSAETPRPSNGEARASIADSVVTIGLIQEILGKSDVTLGIPDTQLAEASSAGAELRPTPPSKQRSGNELVKRVSHVQQAMVRYVK